MNIRLYEDERDALQFQRKGWTKETYQSTRPSRRKCEPCALLCLPVLPLTTVYNTRRAVGLRVDAA